MLKIQVSPKMQAIRKMINPSQRRKRRKLKIKRHWQRRPKRRGHQRK
jgi:hypothetical protein